MGLGAAIAVNRLPDPALDNADSVEVVEQMGDATSYRLHYALDISTNDLPLLREGRLGPGSLLSVLVPAASGPECLVMGPVHAQHIHLEHGGAGSRLEVRGADTSIELDREMKSRVWDGVRDGDAAFSILEEAGYLPDVAPTNALHAEAKHTLVQRDSDLRFVRRLARRNGFLFWVTADPLGIETAHFRPPPLSGEPAAELTINVEDPSLLSLDVDWDVERPTSTEGLQLDLSTKATLDGAAAASPLAPLGSADLRAISGDTRSIHISAPGDDGGDLRARGEGALVEAGWFVTAKCATTVESLGAVVRAHTTVEVKGAGKRHSGRYFVTRVRHLIDATAHRMELELRRNAWEG
jgi:hypothetical protein